MDAFLEFLGGLAVPWGVGFFIALAIFLFGWFLLGEIFGPKIRREIRRRAKRINRIRKNKIKKRRKQKRKRQTPEKQKKILERFYRMKKSAELREKKEYLLIRLIETGVRKIYRPKS